MTVRRAVLISYGLAVFFTIAGGAVVVIRERYAVGFYLVLFGYIVVTAVKIGMVHEKAVVVQREPLGVAVASTVPVPGGWADNGPPRE
jgi:purine-cytosine permease-like protein